MRNSLAAFLLFVSVIFFFVSPHAVFAGGLVSKELAKICPKGLEGSPPGKAEFSVPGGTAGIDSYVQKAACANACFNQVITVDIKISAEGAVQAILGGKKPEIKSKIILDTQTSRNKKCPATGELTSDDAKKAGVGCEFKDQPQLSLKLSGTTKGPVSRCYDDIAKAIDGAIDAIEKGDIGAVGEKLESLTKLDREAPLVSSLDGGTNQALSQALQEQLGLDAENAQKVVESGNAQAALQAIAKNDEDALEKALKDSDVELSEGVRNNFARLSDDERKKAGEIAEGADPSDPHAPPNTFDPTVEAGPLISKIKEEMAGAYERLRGFACRVGRVTCDINNPGALEYGAFAAKYGGARCPRSSRYACFESIEGGLAAQAALLSGSKYFGSGNMTILQATCKYAAPPENDCVSYARFVSNYTGIPLNQTIDPKNAGQIGSIVMAMNAKEGGINYSLDQLQRGLEIAYGTRDLPAGTPGFSSLFKPGTGADSSTRFNSPFDFIRGPASYAAPVGRSSGSSSFAQPTYSGSVAPRPVSAGSSVGGYTYGQPTTALPQPQVSSTLTPESQRLEDALRKPGSSSPPSATPIEPSARIMVQPKEVRRGDPLVVSWSTLGMSEQNPCIVSVRILQTNAVLARLNEGSRKIRTSATSTPGTWNFALQCVSASGATIERSDSALVR